MQACSPMWQYTTGRIMIEIEYILYAWIASRELRVHSTQPFGYRVLVPGPCTRVPVPPDLDND